MLLFIVIIVLSAALLFFVFRPKHKNQISGDESLNNDWWKWMVVIGAPFIGFIMYLFLGHTDRNSNMKVWLYGRSEEGIYWFKLTDYPFNSDSFQYELWEGGTQIWSAYESLFRTESLPPEIQPQYWSKKNNNERYFTLTMAEENRSGDNIIVLQKPILLQEERWYTLVVMGRKKRRIVKTEYSFSIPKSSEEREPIPDGMIDMGLGVYWGRYNLGASDNNPSNSGANYAWGEVYPKEDEGFNLSNYKYYDSSTERFTKYDVYCNDLEPEDDAATQYSFNWRMPNGNEWEDLKTKCNWTYTQREGVYGYEVKSPLNDNCVFIPQGNYWSRNNNAEWAFGESFLPDDFQEYAYHRESGLHIRPVAEIKTRAKAQIYTSPK